ncbi:unnamed protein product [Paramecium primaurelia]|uniref:Uncharacterized protein n=1 Tax=Paramecium primaurelia TaxID=5886 RepID=A0A8S1PQT4_PARPR|nr:unnamed protein product [Paramecium primaurelia]
MSFKTSIYLPLNKHQQIQKRHQNNIGKNKLVQESYLKGNFIFYKQENYFSPTLEQLIKVLLQSCIKKISYCTKKRLQIPLYSNVCNTPHEQVEFSQQTHTLQLLQINNIDDDELKEQYRSLFKKYKLI